MSAALFDFQAGEDVTPAKLNRRFNAEQAYTNVLLFGAKGDGTTDDTTRLQAALDGAGPGDVLYFPGPGFLTTAPLVVNNPWVTLLSDGAVIKSADPTNGAKIQINASNVTVSGLVLDGANVGTSATPSFSYGMIDVVNDASTSIGGLKVSGCTMQNSVGIGLRIIGNVDGVEYAENTFIGNFIHAFMEPDGVYAYRNIFAHDNQYLATWYTGTFSGAVKCKGDGSHSLSPYGLRFMRERVLASAEMGIELFDTIRDSEVVGCFIDGVTFGVSLDNCRNVLVACNKIWRNGYTGIELANQTNRCLVMGNSIEEYSTGTTRGGNRGMVSSGPACFENSYIGNTVRGCIGSACELQGTDSDVVQGNRFTDCGSCFVPKAANRVTCARNHFFGPCDQHVFVDVNDADTSGIDITDNLFYGAASSDNITVYDGGRGRILTNLHIARNNVVSATNGSLSINLLMPRSQLPNLQIEDNYYKVGVAGAAQFAADATSYELVPPFARSMHRGGLTVATKRLIELPVNASPCWVQLVALTLGSSFLQRLHIFAHNASGSLNNEISAVIAAAPYDQGSAIELLPSGRYVPGVIEEIIYNNPGGPSHEVWVKVKAVADPVTLQCHFSDYPEGVVVTPVAVGTEPTWAASNYRLTVGEMDTTYSRQTPAMIARNFIASCDRGAVVNAQARIYARGVAQTGYPGNTRVARFDLDDGSECLGVDDAGQTLVSQKLVVGAGATPIDRVLSEEVDGLDFGSFADGATQSTSCSFGGARVANRPNVLVSVAGGLPAGISIANAYVAVDDFVEIQLVNASGAFATVGPQDVRITVIQF